MITLDIVTPQLDNSGSRIFSIWKCADFRVEGCTLIIHDGWIQERRTLHRNGLSDGSHFPHGAKEDPRDHWLILPAGTQITIMER